MESLTCFLALLQLIFFCPGAAPLNFISNYTVKPALQVGLSDGIVQGIAKNTAGLGMPYVSFEGIPYAKPPLGELRFQPPQPPEPWTGILAADGENACCMQIPPSDLYESEDCLYINVYVPKRAPEDATPKPVMVWIYGGGFLFGKANSSFYGPDFLLEEDVIVVHFHYRVNAFGFLSTGDLELPGNYGLKDQNAALKWVHDNIQHFGGDPDKITIFGESAGGASVQFHLLSPRSRGLFSRAISESGSALCRWAVQPSMAYLTRQIGLATGFPGGSSKELVEHLKGLSAQKLRRAATSVVIVNSAQFAPGIIFGAVLEPPHDTAFLTQNPYESLQRGDFYRVPYITGFNSQEAGGTQAILKLVEPVLSYLPNYVVIPKGVNNDDKAVAEEIRKYYFRDQSTSKSHQYMNFFSDISFYRPILKSARMYSNHAPVYMYLFSYDGYLLGKKAFATRENSKSPGVMHAEEIWYIFGRYDLTRTSATDKLVRKRMLKLWTNFAKFRNPTPVEEELLGNITWPQFQADDYSYLNINQEIGVENNFKQDMVDFWEHIFDKYGRPPYSSY